MGKEVTTNEGLLYWTKRAKLIGMNNFEITILLSENDVALPFEVRKREEAKQALIQQERKNKISVEGNTIELSVAFAIDPADHCHEVRQIELKNGNYIKIYVPPSIGQPTEFDLNILLTCFKIGQPNDYQEYRVTNYQIIKELGQNENAQIYKAIDDSFRRLGACYIETNNWWNPIKKKRATLAAFNFFQKYEYDKETGERCIKFSNWVEESLRAKYLKQIDYKKATKARGAAKILYLILTKLIGNKKYFEISEELVLRLLGKWDKYNSMDTKQKNKNIKRNIDPKMKEAIKDIGGYLLNKEGVIFQIKAIDR